MASADTVSNKLDWRVDSTALKTRTKSIWRFSTEERPDFSASHWKHLTFEHRTACILVAVATPQKDTEDVEQRWKWIGSKMPYYTIYTRQTHPARWRCADENSQVMAISDACLRGHYYINYKHKIIIKKKSRLSIKMESW